jgi:hypothetical protein
MCFYVRYRRPGSEDEHRGHAFNRPVEGRGGVLMTSQRCDDREAGAVASGWHAAVGLIRRDEPVPGVVRWWDRVTLPVRAWLHGYRLVGVLELTTPPGDGEHGRVDERDVVDRMSELVRDTGARTVLTLGAVDLPELEAALAWSGLRARPVERWQGRRTSQPW